jgi:di/tricarboxylate transporter
VNIDLVLVLILLAAAIAMFVRHRPRMDVVALLMMPLSFAALISGVMTLVAITPNLVVNAELVRQGEGGYSLLFCRSTGRLGFPRHVEP